MTIQFYIFADFLNFPDLLNFHERKRLSTNQVFARNLGAPIGGGTVLVSKTRKKIVTFGGNLVSYSHSERNLVSCRLIAGYLLSCTHFAGILVFA